MTENDCGSLVELEKIPVPITKKEKLWERRPWVQNLGNLQALALCWTLYSNFYCFPSLSMHGSIIPHILNFEMVDFEVEYHS